MFYRCCRVTDSRGRGQEAFLDLPAPGFSRSPTERVLTSTQPRLLYLVLLRQAANLFDVAAYPVRGNLENLRLRLA